MNLALKYRPKTLEALVGQSHIVRIIKNAIEKNNLRQQYLLVGPIGSGKTSLGRIIAASENCLISPGISPCGTCNNCKKIFSGTHTDVDEIDAASKAGKVEEIRKLKANAMYNPIDGCKKKIFILDECHRLSYESGDALLKLLEEPPEHVRFILSTTDVQKLRPAIQSRCQRHDFRKIYWAQIAESLQQIAKKEKINYDEEALILCARMANGSMRNALYNMEKLIDNAGSGKLTSELAEDMFGSVNELLFYDLVDTIINEEEKMDASSGFKIINNILRNGTEFETVFQGIQCHLRNMLVALTASKAGEFISVSQEGKRRLKEQCKKCQINKKIKALFNIKHSLNKAKEAVAYNVDGENALQTWFVESLILYRE